MTDTQVEQPPVAMPALDVVVLDCPDPAALADFYCRLLGWTVAYSDDSWVTISATGTDEGTKIAFQSAPDYQPPTWPEGPRPQMVHLDLSVPDLDAAHAHAIGVGASPTGLPDSQTASFRVYTDPAGHPFCLCRE